MKTSKIAPKVPFVAAMIGHTYIGTAGVLIRSVAGQQIGCFACQSKLASSPPLPSNDKQANEFN